MNFQYQLYYNIIILKDKLIWNMLIFICYIKKIDNNLLQYFVIIIIKKVELKIKINLKNIFNS